MFITENSSSRLKRNYSKNVTFYYSIMLKDVNNALVEFQSLPTEDNHFWIMPSCVSCSRDCLVVYFGSKRQRICFGRSKILSVESEQEYISLEVEPKWEMHRPGKSPLLKPIRRTKASALCTFKSRKKWPVVYWKYSSPDRRRSWARNPGWQSLL